MAINPLLSLRTQSLDTATPVRNLIDMRQQKEQLDLQRRQADRQERMMDLREQKVSADIIQQQYERQSKEEQERLRNAALASAQLNRVLENQGPEAAAEWIRQNREGNDQFRLPKEDMDKALNMIEQGNIDQLKTGLSNNIYVGESLGLIEQPEQPEQWVTITDDEGNVLGQRNRDTGKVISDPRAPDDPRTQVDVTTNVGGDKYDEVQAKNRAERINQLVETGRNAVSTERNLNQMADLLTSGVQTGAAQPAITSVQALAEDFGLDLSNIADRVGIENLSNLGGREEFDRLAKTVIIEGFEKFKGNLNDREVKLAMDAFANLGKSEEGNLRAIASLKAAQSLAKERGRRASQVTSEAEARALEGELFEGSQERFETLRQEFEQDLRERMPDEQAGPTRERANQQGQQGQQDGNIELDPETQRLLEKYQ